MLFRIKEFSNRYFTKITLAFCNISYFLKFANYRFDTWWNFADRLYARVVLHYWFERLKILLFFKIAYVNVGSASVLHVRFDPEPDRWCIVNTITGVRSRQSGLIDNLWILLRVCLLVFLVKTTKPSKAISFVTRARVQTPFGRQPLTFQSADLVGFFAYEITDRKSKGIRPPTGNRISTDCRADGPLKVHTY